MAEVTKTVQMLLCDPCLKNGKERRAIDRITVQFLGEQPLELDICRIHLGQLESYKPGAKPRTHRTVKTPERCPICGEMQSSQYTLGQHTKNMHRDVSHDIAQLKAEVRTGKSRGGGITERGQEALNELGQLYDRARRAWEEKNAPATPQTVSVGMASSEPVTPVEGEAKDYPLSPDTTEQVHA